MKDNSSGVVDQDLATVTKIIKAAVILNNRAIMANLPEPLWAPDVQVAVPDPQFQDRDDGVQRRNHLIRTFFNWR